MFEDFNILSFIVNPVVIRSYFKKLFDELNKACSDQSALTLLCI